ICTGRPTTIGCRGNIRAFGATGLTAALRCIGSAGERRPATAGSGRCRNRGCCATRAGGASHASASAGARSPAPETGRRPTSNIEPCTTAAYPAPMRHLVEPETKVELEAIDAEDTGDYHDKAAAEVKLAEDVKRLTILQERLYAENRRALLVVL